MKHCHFATIMFIVTIVAFTSCEKNEFETIDPNKVIHNFSGSPNAEIPLKFNNYLGNEENIHPKVIYFNRPWHGFSYWMAYTPYPKGNVSAENPCIAVSKDGVHWSCPEGLANPLAGKYYLGNNSDTHLVYNEENDTLECWWHGFQKPYDLDLVFRRVSRDGVVWSETETVMPEGQPGVFRLSPAIIIHDGKYILFYSDGADIYEIHCAVNDRSFSWSAPVLLPINRGDLRLWHQDVILNDSNELEFVICAFEPGGNNNTADLYYVKGDIELNDFTDPVKILGRSENKNAFDSRSIYRASIVKKDQTYMVFYSAIDNQWKRYMALSIGDSPFTLRGYNHLPCPACLPQPTAE